MQIVSVSHSKIFRYLHLKHKGGAVGKNTFILFFLMCIIHMFCVFKFYDISYNSSVGIRLIFTNKCEYMLAKEREEGMQSKRTR